MPSKGFCLEPVWTFCRDCRCRRSLGEFSLELKKKWLYANKEAREVRSIIDRFLYGVEEHDSVGEYDGTEGEVHVSRRERVLACWTSTCWV